MKKVTFCAYDKPDSVGGPVSWIQRLAPRLAERGFNVRCLFILHWGETGVALASLRDAGIECEVAIGIDRTEDRIQWILQKLRENPPDIFVPNLVVAAYFAARWAREAGIRTVGVLHSDDEFYRAIQDEFVFGPAEFRVSSVVCVSEVIELEVISRNPDNVIVRRIPYGVSLPVGRVQPENGRIRLAFVGRLAEEQKRIGEVTRALCRVASELTGTEARIYGEGPDRQLVEDILANEGRGLPVYLEGRIDPNEVQGKLLDTDVLVLLSDYEGLPIALLEAMACGCIPVCLNIKSGIPELVEDGISGLLVADRDDSFVAAIKRLRDEPIGRAEMSSAARHKIETIFSETRSVNAWCDLFHLLGTSSLPPNRIGLDPSLDLPPVNNHLASADVRVAAPMRQRSFLCRGLRRLLALRIESF